MKVNSRFAGLIIATGDRTNYMESGPLGRAGHIPVLKRLVSNMQAAGAYPIVVVTGQDAWETEHSLSDRGVIFIRAKDYKELTMMQMIQGGCAYLEEKHKLIIAASVEFPFVQSETIKAMSQIKCKAGMLSYHRKPAFPIIIAGDFIRRIQKIVEEEGRGVLDYILEQQNVAVIATEDAGALARAESSGELPKSLKGRGGRMFHPYLRSEIGTEDEILDPRMKAFLHLLDETHSIKIASSCSGLTVLRALAQLEILETVLGYPLVERGREGTEIGTEDYAELTAAGNNFFAQYEKYERQLFLYAERTFNELFHGR